MHTQGKMTQLRITPQHSTRKKERDQSFNFGNLLSASLLLLLFSSHPISRSTDRPFLPLPSSSWFFTMARDGFLPFSPPTAFYSPQRGEEANLFRRFFRRPVRVFRRINFIPFSQIEEKSRKKGYVDLL